MILNVLKSKRRVNGKIVVSRLYRGRYRLGSQTKAKSVALHTTDKQIATKLLRKIAEELQQEQAGMIAPKLQRQASQVDLDGVLHL